MHTSFSKYIKTISFHWTCALRFELFAYKCKHRGSFVHSSHESMSKRPWQLSKRIQPSKALNRVYWMSSLTLWTSAKGCGVDDRQRLPLHMSDINTWPSICYRWIWFHSLLCLCVQHNLLWAYRGIQASDNYYLSRLTYPPFTVTPDSVHTYKVCGCMQFAWTFYNWCLSNVRSAIYVPTLITSLK